MTLEEIEQLKRAAEQGKKQMAKPASFGGECLIRGSNGCSGHELRRDLPRYLQPPEGWTPPSAKKD